LPAGFGSGNFYANYQRVTIPVSVDPANPGSYLSDATFSFGTHAITLNSGANFNVGTGKFSATTLNTPINFTTDDGTGQTITGTITFAFATLSSTKDITSFTLADTVATISGSAISVTLPHGTNLTALVPTITHTGVSISPADGQAQDFSAPLTYTVTAEDGSTQAYTVTVKLAAPPEEGGGSTLPPTGDISTTLLLFAALLSTLAGTLVLTCWFIKRNKEYKLQG
jgi:hypothetical protein